MGANNFPCILDLSICTGFFGLYCFGIVEVGDLARRRHDLCGVKIRAMSDCNFHKCLVARCDLNKDVPSAARSIRTFDHVHTWHSLERGELFRTNSCILCSFQNL